MVIREEDKDGMGKKIMICEEVQGLMWVDTWEEVQSGMQVDTWEEVQGGMQMEIWEEIQGDVDVIGQNVHGNK